MADSTHNPTPSPSNGGNNNYKTIDELLKLSKIAIENAISSADLSVPLAKKGYDAAAMFEAQTIYNKADALHLAQKKKYGDKYGATDAFEKLKAEVDDEYEDHLNLARIVLKNNRGDLEKLQANGARKTTISGRIGQAKSFYTNALSSGNIKAALAKKGITEAELQSQKDKVEALEKKQAEKYETKGTAQNATADRNDAIEDLVEWYKEFVDTAKVAFKKSPQQLEKLGIIATD